MIVEDNDVVRDSLIKFFSDEQAITVVAEAPDGSTALGKLKANPDIDIVMVDWNMPDMDGLQLTSNITSDFPQIKVAILTMHSKQEYKDKAKAAGASGYILKDGEFEDLVKALHDIAGGKPVFQ